MMRSVNRFENNLLSILYAILGQAPIAQVVPLLVRSMKRPKCLSRDCVELAKQALAKGCIQRLAHWGGWRRQRFLRNEQVSTGRLWQRTRPEDLGLHFSPESLEFLLHITSVNTANEDDLWQPLSADPLPLGDRLLLFFAYDGVRDTRAGQVWRNANVFRGHLLCRLAFPDDFPADAPVAVEPWLAESGPALLEALQPKLAAELLRTEHSKSRIVSPNQMRALGESQSAILSQWLQATDDAGRRDLCRWLLDAAGELLRGRPQVQGWTGALDVSKLRLADRSDVYQSATAYLRIVSGLRKWERQAVAIGYFDEGYQAAQLWKSDWEQYQGDLLCDQAETLIRALEPMSPGTTPQAE